MIEKLEAVEQIGKIVLNTDSSRIRTMYGRSQKIQLISCRQEPQEIEMELTSDKLTAAMLEHTDGEHFLQLGAIFPFVKQDTIERVIETYCNDVLNSEDRRYDSVFTIRAFDRRLFDSDNYLVREDRPNTFIEDGILHVFNRTAFTANGNRKVGRKPYSYSVHEIENMAIDSEENYKLARFVDENRHLFPRVFGR